MSTSTSSRLSTFLWGTRGPAGHACQLYAAESDLLDMLTGYAGGALWNGESVVIIATDAHNAALERRLRESGLDLGFLRGADRFVSVSAEATLAQVCEAGRPVQARFAARIDELTARAGAPRRAVRAYGEMVAVLWSRGEYEAAIELEQLWNRYLEGRALPLLCAYARRDFERAGTRFKDEVRRAHAMVIA